MAVAGDVATRGETERRERAANHRNHGLDQKDKEHTAFITCLIYKEHKSEGNLIQFRVTAIQFIQSPRAQVFEHSNSAPRAAVDNVAGRSLTC